MWLLSALRERSLSYSHQLFMKTRSGSIQPSLTKSLALDSSVPSQAQQGPPAACYESLTYADAPSASARGTVALDVDTCTAHGTRCMGARKLANYEKQSQQWVFELPLLVCSKSPLSRHRTPRNPFLDCSTTSLRVTTQQLDRIQLFTPL